MTKYSLTVQLASEEFRRDSRDAIKSEINRQLMEQIHNIATSIERENYPPLVKDVSEKPKSTKKLGSLEH